MFIHPETSATWNKKSVDVGVVTGSVIWTPTTGNTISISDIIISCSAGNTVTIFFDTDTTDNRVFKGYFAANSGVPITFSGKVPASLNAVLKVTTTAGNTSITILGIEALNI